MRNLAKNLLRSLRATLNFPNISFLVATSSRSKFHVTHLTFQLPVVPTMGYCPGLERRHNPSQKDAKCYVRFSLEFTECEKVTEKNTPE